MAEYPISLVMPALNEEPCLDASIRNVLESFRAYGIRGELVVVDDGSRDRTGEIADRFAAAHGFVRVIHHDRPMGIGASFWDGVRHARGEVVAMIPGDGENDAAEIFRYLPLLDQVDIVVPFAFNPGVRPWRRRLLSFLYHQIIYVTFALSLNYLNGTVLYRKAIFEGITLKSRGFFYQTELLIKTIGRDYLYAEVPYALKRRHGGRSKATTLKSLSEVIRAYCSIVFDVYSRRNRPFAGISPGSATARRLRELDGDAGPRADASEGEAS
jgi:glycosyltransferase involved in cell wall biosynthesis